MEEINPLYEQRLLVFMEDIEKGVFNQVLLGATQFKKMSDAVIAEEWSDEEFRSGFKMARTRINGKGIPADIFIGCESITKVEGLKDADQNSV